MCGWGGEGCGKLFSLAHEKLVFVEPHFTVEKYLFGTISSVFLVKKATFWYIICLYQSILGLKTGLFTVFRLLEVLSKNRAENPDIRITLIRRSGTTFHSPYQH